MYRTRFNEQINCFATIKHERFLVRNAMNTQTELLIQSLDILQDTDISWQYFILW